VTSEFDSIFARLRGILEPYAARLKLSADQPDHFCLDVPFSQKLKKGYPIAWVKVSKSYVSYHFMPVYMFPKLCDSLSEKLRARMQGKSCFNSRTVDEALFTELEQLTTKGFALGREAGFGP
jgi:hypothetical protein